MIFQYKDVHGYDARREIDIYQHPDFTAVYYSASGRVPLDQGGEKWFCDCVPHPGFAEGIATLVCREHQIPHAQLVLIEHSPPYTYGRGSTWNLVTFRSNGHRLAYPKRKPLAINEVKAIIFKGQRPTDYKHAFLRMMNHTNTRVRIEFTAPDKIKYGIQANGVGYEECECPVERGAEGKPVIEMVLKDIETTSTFRFLEIREVQIHSEGNVHVHCNTYNINEIDPCPESPDLRDDDGTLIIPEPRIMPINMDGQPWGNPNYYPFVPATYHDTPPQFRWEDSVEHFLMVWAAEHYALYQYEDRRSAGRKLKCDIKIYPHPGFTVVLCTQIYDDDNPYAEISESILTMPQQVCAKYNIDPKTLVWIEYYPYTATPPYQDQPQQESWAHVTFESEGEKPEFDTGWRHHTGWTSLSRAEAKAIIAGKRPIDHEGHTEPRHYSWW